MILAEVTNDHISNLKNIVSEHHLTDYCPVLLPLQSDLLIHNLLFIYYHVVSKLPDQISTNRFVIFLTLPACNNTNEPNTY